MELKNQKMNQHGSYKYRLTKGQICTDERDGHSLYHLMAARIITEAEVKSFLEKTLPHSDYQISHFEEAIDTNVIIDDIRQVMTIFPPFLETHWRENSGLSGLISWQEFREITAWKSPLEIAEEIRIPFGWNYALKKVDMHDVIWAAVCESHRKIHR